MAARGSVAQMLAPIPVDRGTELRLVRFAEPAPTASGMARKVHAAPYTGLHPWFPLSPCGDGCLAEHRDTVSAARAAGRVARAAAVVAAAVWTWPLLVVFPRSGRRRFVSGLSRQLLVALGLTVVVDDRRAVPGRFDGLVVANHISYLDIAAIAGVCPARFVAKAEIADIPGAAVPAVIFRTIKVQRNSLRQLPTTVGVVAARLARDRSVAVFPEGTTRCGMSAGTFAPAFFQAAIDADAPVLPVGLTFTTAAGTCAAAAFIGDDAPWDTLLRVVRTRGLTVRITVHESQAPGTDRRELALRCERLIGTAVHRSP